MRDALASPFSTPLTIGVMLTLQVLITVLALARGFEVAPEGPPLQMALTAQEIWETGSLASNRFPPIHEQLQADAQRTGETIWQDLYAQTQDDRLIAMHAPIVSMGAAPLVGLLGPTWGVLVVNQLCVVAVMLGLVVLLRHVLGGSLHALSVVLLAFGSPLLLYAPALSHDLFGTALIVGGLALCLRFPFWGAVVIGLSVFVRPTNAAFGALALLPVMTGRRSALGAVAAGLALPWLAFLALNHHWFGAPWLTANHRMPRYTPDGVIFYVPDVSLWRVFGELPRKLFAGDVGFLTFTPAVLALPFALGTVAKHPWRRFFVLFAMVAVLEIVVVFGFHCWDCSTNGNRYLLPVSCLLILPAALAAHKVQASSDPQTSVVG